ncbi:ABC transporter substrate-binding protein [Streptomyces griseorubiginosus]|uniref:ABC transporter substrate-binding protein n=1 Tax=Streptomyces griseorubiginosus TaxID=67304 RepID=UPI0036E29779
MDTTSPAAVAIPPGVRRRGRRTAALVAVACTSALLATACAGGGDNGKASSDPAKPELVSQLPAAAAKDVDHITIALPKGEPASIDPLQAIDYSPDLVISNLCDPILRLTPDFDLKPNVATSWKWKDKKTLVLTIRKGIKFWDGKDLTAEDVAYSLERSLGPASLTGGTLATAKSASATGPYEVSVKFSSYDEQYVKQLAAPGNSVIEKAWAEKAGKNIGTAKGGLMCSGPFKFGSWASGSAIELERNDAYWNPAYKAHAKRVTLKFLTDSSALTQALESGEADGAWEVPPAVISSLKSSKSGSLHYGPAFQYLELTAGHDGPLADKNVRKALFKAIDRKGIADVVYKGAATPNYTVLPPSSRDKGAEDLYAAAARGYEKANAYDIDAAKKLVASSKTTDKTLKLATMAGDETQSQVAQLIQQEAKAIGLNVSIDALQPLQYGETFVNPSARKGIDLIIVVGYNQTTDPLEQLGFLAVQGSPYNVGFDDPVATKAYMTARGIEDPRERAPYVLTLQKHFESSHLVTSLVAPYEISYFSDKLTGATTSMAYMFTPSLALLGSRH